MVLSSLVALKQILLENDSMSLGQRLARDKQRLSFAGSAPVGSAAIRSFPSEEEKSGVDGISEPRGDNVPWMGEHSTLPLPQLPLLE